MTKVIKARLKFHDNMPFSREFRLSQLGFTLHARKKDDWVIYIKYVELNPKPTNVDVSYHDLSNEVQNDLTRRCNHIYNSFVEPQKHLDTIKVRLRNMANTREPKQREWVLAWARRNCGDTPWVIDAEVLKQEVQEKLF